MTAWRGTLTKIDQYRYLIPRSYKDGMRTDGLIYASEKMVDKLTGDDAPEQVANVATLPGIIGVMDFRSAASRRSISRPASSRPAALAMISTAGLGC
jgi:hypothetical protein